MSRIVVHAFVTLDGVVQAGGGPDEDREGGFEHGGWMMGYDEQMDKLDEGAKIIAEWESKTEALLLGRKTYEIWAGAWFGRIDDGLSEAVDDRIVNRRNPTFHPQCRARPRHLNFFNASYATLGIFSSSSARQPRSAWTATSDSCRMLPITTMATTSAFRSLSVLRLTKAGTTCGSAA